MIHLGNIVHHDGHGLVPIFTGCDCEQCQHDAEYWDKEEHYQTKGSSS